MVRHATIQYRIELQQLSHAELYVRLGRVGLGSAITPAQRHLDALDAETDQTAEDLLRVLRVTPVHVLGECPLHNS
jgi:hypothetical protein